MAGLSCLALALASRPSGLDQEALPLGAPFSPKGKGAGGRASLHPAESLLHCMGVNGALRRVLIRSVLACGCAPLRLARPPLTPTLRAFLWPIAHRRGGCCGIGFARKLPVQA